MLSRSFALALFLLLTCCLHAQNITIDYQKSDALFVCGADTFFIRVQNTAATPMNAATLEVALPTGITYTPGSVAGATEQNISNPQQALFALPGIASGATALVAILIAADCAAADALDAGELFVATLSVTSAAGNASIVTTGFTVETGLLLIESVTDLLMSGEKGDTLLREICVKNTRLGKIGNLSFEDEHPGGFRVFVPAANSQSGDSLLWKSGFEGNFFSSFGNGDTWLDLGEKACFTEQIIITDCGTPEFTSSSVLRAGWGCGGAVCRYDSVTAGIDIKKSTRIPDLTFVPVWNPPTDYCGVTPAVMGLKIANIGKAEAKDVLVRLYLTPDFIGSTGMGPSSFRIVHGNSVTPLAPNLSTGTTLDGCNVQAASDASLVIPLVAAKDSIQLLFDVFTCVGSCKQVLPQVFVEYFYRKPCPPNGFVSDTTAIFPDGGYLLGGFTGFDSGVCMQDGGTYIFNYQVVSKRLVGDDGFLHVEFDLPLGLALDDSCQTRLGGVSPAFTAIAPSANGGSSVHLAWEMPLPNDSLDMDFCLKYTCDTNITCLNDFTQPDGSVVVYSADCNVACFLQLDTRTYWTPLLSTPYTCAIGDCDSMRMVINASCLPADDEGGGGDTTTLDIVFPLPGLKKWFDVYRINYGLADHNNDRSADNGAASPAAAGPEVRRDRYLPGDTLRVEYCGIVDSGGGLMKFGRTIWHEVVRSDMGGAADNDIFLVTSAVNSFVNANYFSFVRDSIRVRYADGTEYSCLLDSKKGSDDQNFFTVNQVNTWPPEVIDNLATQRFRFEFSLETLHQSGCLPKPTLDLGDSIFLYTDFRIGLNFKPVSGNQPDPPLVGFRTAVSGGGKVYAYNLQPFKKAQYSGIRSLRTPNTHSIRACENSQEGKKFRQLLRIARENMFPFEVRPIARIVDYEQSVPPGLELASAKLDYLVLQDSVPRLQNLSLPFVETPGWLDLDFSSVFADPVDEGFTLRTSLLFKPDCLYDRPDSSRQYVTLEYTNCPSGDTCLVRDSVINGIGFFSNAPDLRLETGDSLVISASKNFDIDFDLRNYVVSPAFNSWVTIIQQSGDVSDLKLYKMPQNTLVSSQNGVFQTGQIGGFSQSAFRLSGRNVSCDPDTLLIVFGWNCTAVSDPEQSVCGRDTFLVELRLEKPELELEVLQEPDFVEVCDTSGYFEFEIYNAKTGFAYDPFATVKLPPGLSIVPGSCEISYPTGNVYVPIPDPENLGGNAFQWNIAAISGFIAANGLPGVEADPQNGLRIRFRTYTECGFVANSQVIYGVRGTEPCGRSTNILNKPGEPLQVEGLNPGYGVVVGLVPIGNPEQYCGGTQEFLVQLLLFGAPSAGDSVYVLLPQGASYVPGSYQASQNAPAGPPDADANGIRLALLPGLDAGDAVSFRFSLAFGASAGCADQLLIVQTRVRTDVFCPALGTTCGVYASTGEAAWNLALQHPELEIIDFGNSITGDQLSASIRIKNIGQVPVNSVTAQVWKDVDGNGVVSPGDILLTTIQKDLNIFPDGTGDLSGLLDIDSTALCQLLIVLPAAENCTCADQVLSYDQPGIIHTEQVFCDYQPVTIGVPQQPGATYKWNFANGLGCDTCATTTYTPSSFFPPGTLVALVLREMIGACEVFHLFTMTFGTAAATVQVDNAVICKGETALLVANPAGEQYQWSPNAGNDPANRQQTVTPPVSTSYSVTVTFDNQCTATATANVVVNQPDTTLLPGLSTCEGEPVDVLGNLTDVPGLYSLALKNAAGCDSLVYRNLGVLPRPSTASSVGFCRGDTLLVLDTLVTQDGQVCRTYTAANGCDSIHCVDIAVWEPPVLSDPDTLLASPDNPVILNGPGGYVTYTWLPDPNCPNCPSITVPSDSGYVEYLLLVTDDQGCEGAIVYRILFFPPCDAQRLRIPNAFTPNGDGVNDVFRVVPYEGLEQIGSLTIYDRWGEKVYENRGNVSWDGSIDGKPGPSDVYVYRIDILCDGEPKAVWGDVTLLR